MKKLRFYQEGIKNSKTLNFAPTFGWLKENLVGSSFLIEEDSDVVLMIMTAERWVRKVCHQSFYIAKNRWKKTLEKVYLVEVLSAECFTEVVKKEGIYKVINDYIEEGCTEFKISLIKAE